VVGLAAELPQLRTQVCAHSRRPFAASKDLLGDGPCRYLGVKTKCACRVWTTLRPLRISGFVSHLGDIEERYDYFL